MGEPSKEFWFDFQKVKFAMFKKMAVESTLQSQMLKEILARVSNVDPIITQKEYHKRYKAEMENLRDWLFENLEPIDLNEILGDDAPLDE